MVIVALLGLEHHLAAGTAGDNGVGGEGTIGEGSYGKGYHGCVWVCRAGVEEGGALGTESRGVGGILLIGSRDHSAIGKQDCSAHVEV